MGASGRRTCDAGRARTPPRSRQQFLHAAELSEIMGGVEAMKK
jgi:hypothetical protein